MFGHRAAASSCAARYEMSVISPASESLKIIADGHTPPPPPGEWDFLGRPVTFITCRPGCFIPFTLPIGTNVTSDKSVRHWNRQK
jgi:hypothetical protein